MGKRRDRRGIVGMFWLLVVLGIGLLLPDMNASGMEMGGFDVSVGEGEGEIPSGWEESFSGSSSSQEDVSPDFSQAEGNGEAMQNSWNHEEPGWNENWNSSGNSGADDWQKDAEEGNSFSPDVSFAEEMPDAAGSTNMAGDTNAAGRTNMVRDTNAAGGTKTGGADHAAGSSSTAERPDTLEPAASAETSNESKNADADPVSVPTQIPSKAPSSAAVPAPSKKLDITKTPTPAPAVMASPVLSFYRSRPNRDSERTQLVILHQKETAEACGSPRFLITGKGVRHILSVRINEIECPWHWQGNFLVLEKPAGKKTNCVELLVLHESGEKIRIEFQKLSKRS